MLRGYPPLTLVLMVSTLVSAFLAKGEGQATTLILALLAGFSLYLEGRRHKEVESLRADLQDLDIRHQAQLNDLKQRLDNAQTAKAFSNR